MKFGSTGDIHFAALATLLCGGAAQASCGLEVDMELRINGAGRLSTQPAKWTLETRGTGWGNQEVESYPSRRQNSPIQGGAPVITAAKETFTGSDGVRRDYTSAPEDRQSLYASLWAF